MGLNMVLYRSKRYINDYKCHYDEKIMMNMYFANWGDFGSIRSQNNEARL